ncbi:cytochrome P450 [Nocardia sp. XZ_19_385]|uniref:cytochrome P450 n=1 Tax=Nocardia sp. XZ_19_385 TaxID=2769488 RepID=UPI001890397D|nr:cytochrome P450 [Nocardia sp. XZ_19_385]
MTPETTRSPACPVAGSMHVVPHGCSRDIHTILSDLPGPIDRVIVLDDLPVWVVTGYDNVRDVLADEHLVKDPLRLPPAVHPFRGRRYPEDGYSLGGRHLISSDAADHTRLRKISTPLLSRRAVQQWRPDIENTTGDLLRAILEHGAGELVGELFEPLSTTIICRVLGIPATAEQTVLAGSRTLLGPYHPRDPQYLRASADLQQLLTELLSERADRPGTDTDLASAAAAAWQNGTVSLRDALGVVRQFITANTINTASVLARTAVTVLSDRQLAETVASEPDSVAAVTEELLRLQSSAPLATWRFAPEPMTLFGARLAAGDIVLAAVDTADHDPAVYPDPHELIPNRAGPPHLAFGYGRHYCAGAELARLEIQAVLLALARHAHQLELAEAPEQLPWTAMVLCHGIARVPVTAHPQEKGDSAS